MLVYFRERIGSNLVNQVNKKMVINQGGLSGFQRGEKKPEKEEKGEEESEPKNQGKLILDATGAPADIRYPNDLGILNQAREQTEEIIDSLYEPIKDKFP
ncbi:MAG: IS5/IS1182 family transposase, partial [Microcystis aeruginosa LG13-11]|nr:IS5/IS1182 family transposase [Microcystis aeruginosa LG13-11]